MTKRTPPSRCGAVACVFVLRDAGVLAAGIFLVHGMACTKLRSRVEPMNDATLAPIDATAVPGLATDPMGEPSARSRQNRPRAASSRSARTQEDRDSLDLPDSLGRLLATGSWDTTPQTFRIVTLSFLADGCAQAGRHDHDKRREAQACVSRALELAWDTRASNSAVRDTDNGLWLSHYNLMLGAAHEVGPCLDPSQHASISSALAGRSMREVTGHVPSYRGKPQRWPADQTATLASLARYDRFHETNLARAPAQRWASYISSHALDRNLGLPWSEVTRASATATLPRGCALSWQTRYLREFDPELATTWWERYKKHFLVDLQGLAGFREWPPGRDGKADVDSGPILFGVGAAATGLGIGAAKAMGDRVLALQFEATGTLVGTMASVSPELRAAAHSALSDAIRYVGAHTDP